MTPLAEKFVAQIEERGLTIDLLAERTKVHRSTLLVLTGQDVNAVIPPRIYLRGHAVVVGLELGLSREESESLFDLSHPEPSEPRSELELPGLPRVNMALAAGLGSIALLAIVLAFVS